MSETLEIMPYNVWLNIHCKGDDIELATLAVNHIVAQQRLHQSFLAADRNQAAAVRSINPEIMICNMSTRDFNTAYVDDTISHADNFIQFSGGIASTADIEKLNAAGIHINSFNGHNAASVNNAFAAGIHFPLVDDIAASMVSIEAVGIEPLNPQFTL